MGISYKDSGVDIDRANSTKDQMTKAVKSTYGPQVLGGHGRFGGMFDIQWLQFKKNPVLVASTDGVGTKTMVAAAAGCFESLGHDLVNHCINDILVQGAKPLFFLDYIASSQLDPEKVLQVVSGIAAACRDSNCALLGGETAEMPGVYQPKELDLVGTIVGWVEREHIIDGRGVAAGDVLIGLPSSGLHTNGYSLARRALEGIPLGNRIPEWDSTLADVLLTPHRSYLDPISKCLAEGIDIKGLVHITGGGFYDNIPRILPEGLGARIVQASWPVLPIFQLIQDRAQIAEREMYHVFNMGIGMIVIVSSAQAQQALEALEHDGYLVGEIIPLPDAAGRTTDRHGKVVIE